MVSPGFDPERFAAPSGVDYYCVVGNPVAHSLSPRIHAMFASATGEALVYDRVRVPEGAFAAALAAFVARGGRGMNVTVPFKGDARQAVDELSARAERAGSVNTIVVRDDGTTLGDNTDGIGLVSDLRVNLGLELSGMSIALVGAGGAARGVVGPLLDAGAASLIVMNRNRDRAFALADAFADPRIGAAGLDTVPPQPVDLIVNATSSGLAGGRPEIDAGWIGRGTVCYDMVYGEGAAPFLDWARGLGASSTADGLGMLVEQAAAAFELWRGIRPDTAEVISALRAGVA